MLRSCPRVCYPSGGERTATPPAQPLNCWLPVSSFAVRLRRINFPHSRNRIPVLRRLVRPQAHNPRKTQRETTVMPVRLHHVVECHLQPNPLSDQAAKALVFNCVSDKHLSHSC